MTSTVLDHANADRAWDHRDCGTDRDRDRATPSVRSEAVRNHRARGPTPARLQAGYPHQGGRDSGCFGPWTHPPNRTRRVPALPVWWETATTWLMSVVWATVINRVVARSPVPPTSVIDGFRSFGGGASVPNDAIDFLHGPRGRRLRDSHRAPRGRHPDPLQADLPSPKGRNAARHGFLGGGNLPGGPSSVAD
jgi:hypothetical protein